MDLIITHAKCPDGWCAALITKRRYPEAEIMPLDHGEPVPFDAVRDKNVIVVDFSWPNREDNIELHRIAKSFHIFDHHKSAFEKLEGLDFVTFDMKRSGAGLAWDYLFGKDSKGLIWPTFDDVLDGNNLFHSRPWYVDYVEDRDLWNWALPDSKAVSSYLMSLPMTVEGWSRLDSPFLSASDAAVLGEGILRHVDRYVQEAAHEAQRGFLQIADGRYLTAEVVNCPYMNCSEVGNVLAKRADVGITWFERADGQTQFSLRSEGDIDVSAIAKTYGGGGHLHAAGFRMNLQEGRRFLDTVLSREWTQETINQCLDALSKLRYPGPRC